MRTLLRKQSYGEFSSKQSLIICYVISEGVVLAQLQDCITHAATGRALAMRFKWAKRCNHNFIVMQVGQTLKIKAQVDGKI